MIGMITAIFVIYYSPCLGRKRINSLLTKALIEETVFAIEKDVLRPAPRIADSVAVSKMS